MRKVPVVRLIFTLTAVAAVGVWAACGGSESQDVIAHDAGSDTGRVEEPKEEEEPDDDERVDRDPEDAAADAPVYDAGEPDLRDGGDIEGGIPCVVGGELEEEPNDDRATANVLNPTRCGVVRVVNDAGESDFLTFELSDASTSYYLQYAGNVHVFLETDGSAPADISQGGSIPLRRGQPYYVEVKSKDGKQQVWRVSLFQ